MHAGERALLARDLLVHVPDGMRILPEDTRDYARPIEALPPPRASACCRERCWWRCTGSAPPATSRIVSDAARGVCSGRGRPADAEPSNLRYIAWAIPAIGFIGTVRGIGDALGEAHKAVTGDVSASPRASASRSTSTLARALDQHRADVPAAPAAARPGAAGARRRDLPRPQPDRPPDAGALSR